MAFNLRGMAGEAELKEIYLGCLWERGEISPTCHFSRWKREKKGEKRNVVSETETGYLMLGHLRVDKGGAMLILVLDIWIGCR